MNRQGYFASQDRVDHSEKEYARHEDGRPVIHTNTVEGYFSVFKGGMRETYQHARRARRKRSRRSPEGAGRRQGQATEVPVACNQQPPA